ncbi:hypothetical protein R5R35_002405 [Gryllus longicercus]|uniref:Accessory gland protein n=1 Tax=Gryllus longicercus TaxID=2509291 RepID=A0AAN9W094_9ORTH
MARVLLVAAALAVAVQSVPLESIVKRLFNSGREKRQLPDFGSYIPGTPGIPGGGSIPGGGNFPGMTPPNYGGFTAPTMPGGIPGAATPKPDYATDKPAEGGSRKKRQLPDFGSYIPGTPGIPGGGSIPGGGNFPGMTPPNCGGFTAPTMPGGIPGASTPKPDYATDKPAEGGSRKKRQLPDFGSYIPGTPGIPGGGSIPGGGNFPGMTPPNCGGFTAPTMPGGIPGASTPKPDYATDKPAEDGSRKKRQLPDFGSYIPGTPGIPGGGSIPGGGNFPGMTPPNCGGFTAPTMPGGIPGASTPKPDYATDKPAEGGSRKKREIHEGSAPGGISSAIQGVDFPDDSVVVEAVDGVDEPAPGSMPAGIVSGGM